MAAEYPKIRLFVESHLEANLQIEREQEQAHYLTRVMRMKEGDALAVFNGKDGEWLAVIEDVRKKHVSLRIKSRLKEYLAPPDVWLCFAPIKFGRIDYLVQKATELGAAKIQPVFTQYTQSERINDKRLHANAIEAAEQCERVEVPEIMEAISLNQLLSEWPEDRLLLFADEGGDGVEPKTWLPEQSIDKWALLIGPEGGFSPQERELLYKHKHAQGISLGPRILRADTAAITMLSLTQCWFGDWHIKPHYNQREAS